MVKKFCLIALLTQMFVSSNLECMDLNIFDIEPEITWTQTGLVVIVGAFFLKSGFKKCSGFFANRWLHRIAHRENLDPQALILAASINETEYVKLLLEKNVDVNTQSEYGQTALHFAADKGNAELVKILIQNGANSALQDKDGMSPFHFALQKGDDVIGGLLLTNSIFNQSSLKEIDKKVTQPQSLFDSSLCYVVHEESKKNDVISDAVLQCLNQPIGKGCLKKIALLGVSQKYMQQAISVWMQRSSKEHDNLKSFIQACQELGFENIKSLLNLTDNDGQTAYDLIKKESGIWVNSKGFFDSKAKFSGIKSAMEIIRFMDFLWEIKKAQSFVDLPAEIKTSFKIQLLDRFGISEQILERYEQQPFIENDKDEIVDLVIP